ncbi:MAG: hypothetical protein AUJ07_02035 [Crenarchaeota archaeon 13_1_40CM_3_53_5]|nr:MAG: hypothetical protein AUJ07_02035 [Crenarchaeota archaeon 13_1_40CM_3_53_5]
MTYQHKFALAEAILIGMVFISPFLSLSLPKVGLPGLQTVDATQHLAPLYGEQNIATILNIGNYTKWSLNTPTLGGTFLTTSMSKLTLNGTFPSSSNPSALSISRQFVANLTQYPILYMLMNVSKGVSYGIRFDTQNSDGSLSPVWSDTDSLNHRGGIGQPENIQVNMIQVISQARTHGFHSATLEVRVSQLSASASSIARPLPLTVSYTEPYTFDEFLVNTKKYPSRRPLGCIPQCSIRNLFHQRVQCV